MSLVLDLRITHDRFGSSSDPSLNGTLHYPNDIDRSINKAATDKIRKYRADYNNNPPIVVSFIPTIPSTSGIGLLVDSEIVLSTRYGKTMVVINKTLSTETAYQQDLINRGLLSTRLIVGKVGPGMWCGKFDSTSNALVCETQRKVNMYGCVSE